LIAIRIIHNYETGPAVARNRMEVDRIRVRRIFYYELKAFHHHSVFGILPIIAALPYNKRLPVLPTTKTAVNECDDQQCGSHIT
jgi:hypothetical protein